MEDKFDYAIFYLILNTWHSKNSNLNCLPHALAVESQFQSFYFLIFQRTFINRFNSVKGVFKILIFYFEYLFCILTSTQKHRAGLLFSTLRSIQDDNLSVHHRNTIIDQASVCESENNRTFLPCKPDNPSLLYSKLKLLW